MVYLSLCSAQCGDGQTLGAVTDIVTTPADDPLGRTYLAHNTYTFDCYGVIKVKVQYILPD